MTKRADNNKKKKKQCVDVADSTAGDDKEGTSGSNNIASLQLQQSSSSSAAASATAATTSAAIVKSSKKKRSGKKKKDNSASTPADDSDGPHNSKANNSRPDDDKNKRRNSLTDSPLTELSPSSTTSNGDSDIDSSNKHKHESSSCSLVLNFGNSESDTRGIGLNGSGEEGEQEGPKTNKHAKNGDIEQSATANRSARAFPHPPIPSFAVLLDAPVTEAENINAIECENAFDILMAQKKHLMKHLKYNKWTDQIGTAIFTGNFEQFYRRFQMVMVCLRKRVPLYRKLSNMELAQNCATIIVDSFNNTEQQITILMVLLTNSNCHVKCVDREHGYCRIAHMLLKLLKRSELQALLDVREHSSGKTVLHLAAATGQPCQLQVLLALTDINANVFDMSGRAAFHYTIERNNLAMVRMLMWYGADISLCHSANAFYDPMQISLSSDPNSLVQRWLSERVPALCRLIRSFVNKLCARSCWVQADLSPVHFVRFGSDSPHYFVPNAPIHRQCQLNLRASNNTSLPQMLKQNPKSRIIIFMIPVSFRTADATALPEDPKLVRVAFPDNSTIVNSMVLYNGKVAHCTAAFHHYHNGFFYAFELARSAAQEGLYTIVFSLKSPTGFTKETRTVLLAIQAYLCMDLDSPVSSGGCGRKLTVLKSKMD